MSEKKTVLERMEDPGGHARTLGDECRNNHVKFRERVRATQQRRNEVATSDGYVLTWKNDPEETP